MSYATVAEAQTYFDQRLNTDAWDGATTVNKQKALSEATLLIDRLSFLGDKTSSSQTYQFPRDDDTSVPDDIKWASAEIALALLDGVDPELEYENLQLRSQGYSSVRATYDKDPPAPHLVAGIPSVRAWRYLRPYLRDNLTFDIYRIS